MRTQFVKTTSLKRKPGHVTSNESTAKTDCPSTSNEAPKPGDDKILSWPSVRNEGHVDHSDRTTAKTMCLAILTEASKVGAFESMYSVINQACPNILPDRTTVKTECLTILNETPKLGANETVKTECLTILNDWGLRRKPTRGPVKSIISETRFTSTYSISNLGFPSSTYKKNPLVSLKIR